MAKILIVDDDPDILLVLRVTLESAGHKVTETSDPLTVLPAIDREEPDAVILDVMMPGVTGWDLLPEIRERPRGRNLPILMLSARGEISDRIRGLRGGADDYQVKPFDAEELLLRVENLIERFALRPAVEASAAAPSEAAAIPELEEAIATLEQRIATKQGLGDLRLGRYEIERVLGTGAMGTVLKVFDPRLRRTVALKTIRINLTKTDDRDVQISRLSTEAQVSAQLSHPHIVTVYDFEEEGQAAFIAMELVEGTTLEKHLAEYGALEVARTIPLAAAIARALTAAHAAGLVHRDIKPGNVLLGHHGAIKVTDFGIAEYVSRADANERVFGTPGYMAPEFMSGGQASPASDLFSLGVILYECLSGRHPFVEKNWRRTLHNTVLKDPRPIGEVTRDAPKALSDLVMKLLEKDADKRPTSAEIVVETLEELATADGLTWILEPPTRPRLGVFERPDTTSRLLSVTSFRFEALPA